jgi:hypothetical protein
VSAPFRDWATMVRHFRENMRRDGDNFIVIDGYERTGKSTLGFQLARAIDPSFDPATVILDYQDFRNVFSQNKRNVTYLLDEGGNLMFSRDSMTGENKILQKILMQVGQTNSTFIMCVPNFWRLDRIVREHRCQAWIHVYRRGLERGHALVGWKRGLFTTGHLDWMPFDQEPRFDVAMRLTFPELPRDSGWDAYKARKALGLARSTDALWQQMDRRADQNTDTKEANRLKKEADRAQKRDRLEAERHEKARLRAQVREAERQQRHAQRQAQVEADRAALAANKARAHPHARARRPSPGL